MTHTDPLPAVTSWWRTTYPALARDLGFDPARDEQAAHLLDRLIDQHDTRVIPLDAVTIKEDAVVAGAADTLQADLRERGVGVHEALIVADGAVTSGLDDAGAIHMIVADLDGDPARLAELNAQGVPLAVHAHGDNMHLLEQWIPRLTGPVLPTRQTPGPEPRRIVCPGGFADGDRSVFLAARLGARRIRLAGFDLLGEPGRHSPTDPEQKRRKMRWSARLLHEAPRLGVPLEDVDPAWAQATPLNDGAPTYPSGTRRTSR